MPSQLCKRCHDAVVEVAASHGYTVTIDQVARILWECTPYPAGCAESVQPMAEKYFTSIPANGHRPTIEELHKAACARIEADTDRALAEMRKAKTP